MLLQDRDMYCCSVRESLKTMLSWGWCIDRSREGDPSSLHNKSRRISQSSQVNMSSSTQTRWQVLFERSDRTYSCVFMYLLFQFSFEGAPAFTPRPIDMSNVTLSTEMQVHILTLSLIPHTLKYENRGALDLREMVGCCRTLKYSKNCGNISWKLCFLSPWQSCWQRITTTFWPGRRKWSWKPKVRLEKSLEVSPTFTKKKSVTRISFPFFHQPEF